MRGQNDFSEVYLHAPQAPFPINTTLKSRRPSEYQLIQAWIVDIAENDPRVSNLNLARDEWKANKRGVLNTPNLDVHPTFELKEWEWCVQFFTACLSVLAHFLTRFLCHRPVDPVSGLAMAPARMYASAKLAGLLPHCYCPYAPNMLKHLNREGCTVNMGFTKKTNEHYFSCHLYDPSYEPGTGPVTCGYQGASVRLPFALLLLTDFNHSQPRPPPAGKSRPASSPRPSSRSLHQENPPSFHLLHNPLAPLPPLRLLPPLTLGTRRTSSPRHYASQFALLPPSPRLTQMKSKTNWSRKAPPSLPVVNASRL